MARIWRKSASAAESRFAFASSRDQPLPTDGPRAFGQTHRGPLELRARRSQPSCAGAERTVRAMRLRASSWSKVPARPALGADRDWDDSSPAEDLSPVADPTAVCRHSEDTP